MGDTLSPRFVLWLPKNNIPFPPRLYRYMADFDLFIILFLLQLILLAKSYKKMEDESQSKTAETEELLTRAISQKEAAQAQVTMGKMLEAYGRKVMPSVESDVNAVGNMGLQYIV